MMSGHARHSRKTPNLGLQATVLTALALAVSPFGVLRAGEVYKSIDAEGHVVYSDRAITPTAQKSVVHVDQPDPVEVARNAKEQQILKAEEFQRKKQQSIVDTKEAEVERNRQVQCDNARNRYYAMKDARRIYHLDAESNRIYYTDAEGEAKREEARQAMEAACGT